MTQNFVWETDPDFAADDAGGRDPDGKKLLSFDPYSQWLLYHGRDFDFAAEQSKEDDEDFNYIAIVTALDKPPTTTTTTTTTTRNSLGNAVQFSRTAIDLDNEEAINNFLASHGRNNLKQQLIFRVPLRKRSVFKGGTLESATWIPPDGLEREKAVVVGVIDDGINFAHERFRTSNGSTRVDFAWLQDGICLGEQSTVPFGRELAAKKIDEAIQKSRREEDLFDCLEFTDFTKFGFNPLSRRSSHGTHVLDIATGFDSTAAPPTIINKRIIGVQLPSLVTQETSGALLNTFVLASVDYILARARVISQVLRLPVPVVLNFSYSVFGGPHNGQHFAERAFQELIKFHWSENEKLFEGCTELEDKKGIVEFVLPAGNRNLSRGHAAVSPDEKDQADLDLSWRLQPGDKNPSYLEIWLPKQATLDASNPKFEFSIGLPGQNNKTTIVLTPDEPKVLWDTTQENSQKPKTIIARISLDEPNIQPLPPAVPDTSGYWRILFALAPTDFGLEERELAPSGVWTVQISSNLPNGGKIEAWIPRDDAPFGFKSLGRQSYFDNPNYRRFDEVTGDWLDSDPVNDQPSSSVKRSGTLSGLATKPPLTLQQPLKLPIVAGGYYFRGSKAPTLYTATSSDTISDPDVLAVTDTSRTLPGIMAAGNRNGSRANINGTSVAAPQAVRKIVDLISNLPFDQRKNFNAVDIIGNIAQNYENVLPDDSYGNIPNDRAKFGRLPVEPALERQVSRKFQE
jgi:hypothetical protein